MRRFFGAIIFCSVVAATCVATTEEERLLDLLNQRNILAVEEAFVEHLVKTALQPRLPGQFPEECKDLDDQFKQVAGYARRNNLLQEYNKALYELFQAPQEEPGMSITTKVLIGGAVAVGTGIVVTGAVIAAPLVLPAAVIAKTTAGLVAVKAAVTAGAVKVTAAGAVVAGKAAAVKSVAVATVKVVVPIVASSALRECCNIMLGETLEQEVKRLKKTKRDRRPLKDLIREAHFVKKNQ